MCDTRRVRHRRDFGLDYSRESGYSMMHYYLPEMDISAHMTALPLLLGSMPTSRRFLLNRNQYVNTHLLHDTYHNVSTSCRVIAVL